MKDTFKKSIESDYVSAKYAKGTSDMRGKEFHTYNEIIFFMGGESKFISDNMQMDLKPDTVMVIPRECYHQLCIKGNEDEYHRCVIHFDDIPALNTLILKKMHSVFAVDANLHIKYLFQKIIDMMDSEYDENTKNTVIFSVLTLLLEEISYNSKDNDLYQKHKTLSSECVEIIDKNLCNNISVSFISEALNISQSGIAHIFKKEMNITIYKYILEKRLILARKKILAGQPATQAASECGFNDYSGFYRQYKKMFNTAPSRS